MESKSKSQVLETICIISNKLTNDEQEQMVNSFTNKLTSEYKGKLYNVEHLGVRKLPYPIATHTEGLYVLFTYTTESNEVEGSFQTFVKTHPGILKSLTVKREIRPDEFPMEDKSEQDLECVDALDVLLGLADYAPIKIKNK